jgi:hypothetical protein
MVIKVCYWCFGICLPIEKVRAITTHQNSFGNHHFHFIFLQNILFWELKWIEIDEERLRRFLSNILPFGSSGILIDDELIFWHLRANYWRPIQVNLKHLPHLRNLIDIVRV